VLPLALLTRYLFFLSRRPISRSNSHFLGRRLAALQALVPALARRVPAALDAPLGGVSALTPPAFGRRIGALLDALVPWLPPEEPPGMMTTGVAPAGFFDGARRLRVVFGPAIGIGDEILCAALPAALRRAAPRAEIEVWSAYDGIWEEAGGGIDRLCPYHDGAGLVAALGGRPPAGAADVIVLADFEKPGLMHALAHEPAVGRYVELSLGARTACALDLRARVMHLFRPTLPPGANHYLLLRQALRFLGAPDAPRPSPPACVVPRDGARARVFVTPFSSKYEPRETFWGRLLARIAAPRAAALRLVLDPGPNGTTARFAASLARALRGLAPAALEVEVAGDGGRTLPLRAALGEIERADVVLCADSFAAHAAPRAGRPTLVLATAGYESWRVPDGACFYFDPAAGAAAVAEGLEVALRVLLPADGACPAQALSTGGGPRLRAAVARLEELLDARPEPPLEPLVAAYDEAFRAYHGALPELRDGPLEPLLRDAFYERLLPPAPPGAAEAPAELHADLRAHLRDQIERWWCTNLLRLLRRDAAAA
jgi:hypothetical protein